MTKQILPNRWFIWALIAIIVVGIGVWGYIQYTAIQDNTMENISITPGYKTIKSNEFSIKKDALYKNGSIIVASIPVAAGASIDTILNNKYQIFYSEIGTSTDGNSISFVYGTTVIRSESWSRETAGRSSMLLEFSLDGTLLSKRDLKIQNDDGTTSYFIPDYSRVIYNDGIRAYISDSAGKDYPGYDIILSEKTNPILKSFSVYRGGIFLPEICLSMGHPMMKFLQN